MKPTHEQLDQLEREIRTEFRYRGLKVQDVYIIHWDDQSQEPVCYLRVVPREGADAKSLEDRACIVAQILTQGRGIVFMVERQAGPSSCPHCSHSGTAITERY